MNDKLPTYKIRFEPTGREVTVATDETVMTAARQAGLHINASCGGSGVCGKCRIILEQGAVTDGRSEKLSAEDFARGYRQACLARPDSDLTVRIPAESEMGTGGLTIEVPIRHRAKIHLFDVEKLRREGVFLPPVEKMCLELLQPAANDNMADAGRILQGLNSQYNERRIVITLATLRKIRRALRDKDFLITVTLARPVNERGKNMLVNVQPGNWSHRSYGLAFDIGTTTVHGNLLDLQTGRVLASGSSYNGQISYGEDVISRIIQAEKPEGLALMQGLVVNTINAIIGQMLKKTAIDRDEISSITLAGNTTMTHLLLGLEPHNIRRAPYVPVSIFFPPIRAQDLNINLAEHAVALVYPAISSYVGGDIVAGVMGSGIYRTDKLTLYVDIGTNAEIVIGNREWLVCAACSAGPAFEGGGITHGMRAAAGAISDFSLHPLTFEPMNITIGNKPPIGICGSGLLIIVAALLENGVINPRGKFTHGLSTPRIREGRSGYEYVLVWKEEGGIDRDIVINEVDIENFTRAKAAIYSGIKTLVEEVGLQVSDIEQIILAGAFGSFIDLDSAITVGLLPEVDPARIVYVGNGSLLGAWMSEMSNHIRKDVVEVVRRMTSFELSEVGRFRDQYVASLFLPHTDATLFPATIKRLTAGNNQR
ncbi:MAG: ferredoxin [Deltaproteobacteria bacterium RIFOXYD12_FULL_57_12]|nr:MAG: ferredoxin [Deltaproteobacteria bacterium RIFOXYD12_FULL_57_12]